MINYKILLIGSREVGKTSILNQFCHNLFINKYQPTYNYNYFSNEIFFDNSNVKINLWDTSGIIQDLHISDTLINNCNSIIIVYDITNVNSFINMEKWVVDLRKMSSFSNCDIILVGNKNDLGNREVNYSEGEKFAKDNNLVFFEVNSKNKNEITNLFISIVEKITKRQENTCYYRCC